MGIYCKKASFIVLCFLFSVFITTVSGQNMFRKMMDFDGDGKADFAITRDVGGARYWYIWLCAVFSASPTDLEPDKLA